MKILVVSNFFPPHFIGGAEIIAHRQALMLAARGHEVRVLAGDISRRIPGYPATTEVFDGLPVTRIALQQADFAPTGNNLAHPEVDRHFERLISQWRPDVIHAHHLAGLSLGILQVARAHGIRVALTLHDHWGFCINSTRITSQGILCQDTTQCHGCHAHIHADDLRLPQRMRQDYLRWQLQAVDHFISPSRYLADAYVATGLPAERMHVVANGIELQRFAGGQPPAAGPRLNILFIGYMGEHKGVPTLLRALALLPGHRVHIDFVGDGHLCAAYQAELRRIAPGLSQRFWGRLPNERIAERLARAHVFVLPSVCPENQPVTITEAMASGLPVVASRIGGIAELVDHGVSGFLAEPGNAEDLAARLRHYIDHPDEIALHGQAGRERMQAFEFERQIERLEALLAGPLAPRGALPPLVACHGQPPAVTFNAVLAELAPLSAGQAQPVSQPCWVPAGWVEPGQADLLWVAGPETGDPARVLARIEAFRNAGCPVLVDERNVLLARRLQTTEGVLLVRGTEQVVLACRALLAGGGNSGPRRTPQPAALLKGNNGIAPC